MEWELRVEQFQNRLSVSETVLPITQTRITLPKERPQQPTNPQSEIIISSVHRPTTTLPPEKPVDSNTHPFINKLLPPSQTTTLPFPKNSCLSHLRLSSSADPSRRSVTSESEVGLDEFRVQLTTFRIPFDLTQNTDEIPAEPELENEDNARPVRKSVCVRKFTIDDE
ncbi:hypothetical protein BLNAU_11396 [Blattamonas nauphoetae]|uniref:Uncharacterized protein n=1 Tax=Blattamonas nauphoetae TaxID=2049346 RepID=A0ABQ9XQC6_9EUKA|nr:hypothetical protein BLNAU_11396 [Blattamonas nauphoetae]